MSIPDYPLAAVLDFKFTSRAFATGIPTTLAGTPTIEVYEDNTAEPIESAIAPTVDFGTPSITGLNNVRVTASTGNGYESGKSYQLVIEAGTVGGVSVVGEVVAQFTIQRAALNFGNVTGTLSGGEFAAGVFAADAIRAADLATGALTADAFAANALIAATFAADYLAAVQAEAVSALQTAGLILMSATIETVNSQTEFVIPATDDATNNDAYNGALAVIIDGTDPNQRSMRLVTDYVAATRAVTIEKAADFTVTNADTLVLLASTAIQGRTVAG